MCGGKCASNLRCLRFRQVLWKWPKRRISYGDATATGVGVFNVVVVQVETVMVFHNTGDLADEVLVVACSPQQVEAQFHSTYDASGGDDSSCVHDASATDATARGNLREPIDRHFARL